MNGEKIAVLFGNDAPKAQMDAARLISEAMSGVDDAEAIISLAIAMFDRAAAGEERRA